MSNDINYHCSLNIDIAFISKYINERMKKKMEEINFTELYTEVQQKSSK